MGAPSVANDQRLTPPARSLAEAEDLPPLRDVIARHGLAAKKTLGQHFLLDLNLTRRIARAAAPLGAGVTVEIGPGPGGLTRALLEEGAARVVAIELDRRCIAALTELQAVYGTRLEVIEGDARDIDIPALAAARPLRIVANLPYNVASPLLVKWLREAQAYESLTLMFQKEVAERLAAKPRTPAYGRLGVLAGWICEVRRLFDVSPRAFTPPPRVTSAVVQLVPRAAQPGAALFEAFEKVTAAAFGQRRKMLRSSLATLGVDAAALLAAAAIVPTARAEELDVAQFATLAHIFSAAYRST
jgi:16S rRNA (adenine1518-N6/adenine1519-N6)-dimethyltransferase